MNPETDNNDMPLDTPWIIADSNCRPGEILMIGTCSVMEKPHFAWMCSDRLCLKCNPIRGRIRRFFNAIRNIWKGRT